VTGRPEIDLPFRWEWRGPNLGPARPAELYGGYPLESLPPIPELDESLSWLAAAAPSGRPMGTRAALDAHDLKLRENLERVEREAAVLGLTLPPAFTRLMRSSALLFRFPEYAGSWFPPLEHVSPCIFGGRGRLLWFLSDQQHCVVWHLYLMPGGGAFVVSSFQGNIDAAVWDDGPPPDAADMAETLKEAIICATSFEAFLYRLWLEICIANKVEGFDDTPLTDDERRYLAHYEAGRHLSVT
jgi:hypothetical protein